MFKATIRALFHQSKLYNTERLQWFSGKTLLPLSAVFVAQLAHFIVVCVFPHECLIFPWHTLGTPRHAEQSILRVGTPCTVSTTLEVKDDVYNILL